MAVSRRPGERVPALFGPRPDVADLIKAKTSMLGAGVLPQGYANIEDEHDVIEAAYNDSKDERLVRLTIVWDNPVGDIPLSDVLDIMRQQGAAMVTKAERITR